MSDRIRHTRPIARAVAAAALSTPLVLGGLAVAPVSQAWAGVVPSTMSLVATPAVSRFGTPVTLAANVSSLASLPGSVAFSASDGTATVSLGSVPIGLCLLGSCPATLTTTGLPVGTTSVTASYAGDVVTSGSAATVPVTVAPVTRPGSSTLVTCYPGVPCMTPTVRKSNTTLQVTATPSSGPQTLTASLGGGLLQCSDPVAPGEQGVFTDTAADASKTATYSLSGSAASETMMAYDSHTTYLACYASTVPFMGYDNNGVYGPAPLVTESFGTVYEDHLSNCANNSGARPCFTNVWAGTGDVPIDRIVVQTLPGDPHVTH